MPADNNNHQKPQSIFWIEVDKIIPNSEQPREYFDQTALSGLAESIRQYGVLQPLVVVRKEKEVPTGTLVEYELIAGERRLRASKIAGLSQIPVIIREDEGEKVRLELAIIENLQREDLNPIEKAKAFKRLIESFKLKHHEVASKLGKSREFVTNSLRILGLPEEMQKGLSMGMINEGHTRPLLMLVNKPEEQLNLYQEIIYRKMSVREAERISRRIAYERAYKKENLPDPETRVLEEKLSDRLGTRVQIEKTGKKGRIYIDFFSEEELRALLDKINEEAAEAEAIAESEAFSSVAPVAVNELAEELTGELEKTLIENPTTPLESEPPEDEDELARNFTI